MPCTSIDSGTILESSITIYTDSKQFGRFRNHFGPKERRGITCEQLIGIFLFHLTSRESGYH